MGQKKRNAKGNVSIINATGRIRLRWRYQQQRYSLNLFAYTRSNLVEAKKIVLRIEQDLLTDSFDPTLEKYKPMAFKKIVEEPEQKLFLELFQQWVSEYRHKNIETDVDYHAMYQMLKRWQMVNPDTVLSKLNKERISARTYNRRLTMLTAFFQWTTKLKYTDCNPLEEVQRKKVGKTDRSNRKPFTEYEISQILDAFRTDKFCPASSTVKHSFYYPFIYFIFKTGVRPAEAIGLRVKYVDKVNRVIEIKEVMARTISGTNPAARIRKETKNGKERQLPLDSNTLKVLKPLLRRKKPDDLVFQSPNGLPIDDRMFQRRIFRKILEGLKIEYRVLYACRHTFGSRCIEAGINPVMTAFLMGNNPETALRNYTHQVSLPNSLPPI